MNFTLLEIKKLEGIIILKSGLHIGSGNMEMHIGGTDSPVIKHPHTLEPYIPGSSLKGKVRSPSGLVPYSDNNGGIVSLKTVKKVKNENTNLVKEATDILKIFGYSGADSEDAEDIGPTRVSFGDCYLDEEWKKKAQANCWQLTEVKSENSINRIKGTAENPHFIERVTEGTKFSFNITFKILEKSDEQLFEKLLKCLKLLEMDSLGGNGSRGYGRVKFEFKDPKITEEFANLKPF